MDLGSLFQGSLPAVEANTTYVNGNMSSGPFSEKMIQNLLPFVGRQFSPLLQSFMVFYNVTGEQTGFDPTVILGTVGFMWAMNKLFRQVYSTVSRFLREYCMADIHIVSGDDIYLHMMRWLANQPHMTTNRSLMVETVGKSAWEEEDEIGVISTNISADGSGVYLNFSNQEAKMPPRFIPAVGVHGFWFQGHYFRVQRKQSSIFDEGSSQGMMLKEKEDLIISCFGISTDPIKRLLQHAKEAYYSDHHAKTIVKRPAPQAHRRYSRNNWLQVAHRPVRPMKTVVLDGERKVQVLKDMNEYLHPSTPRWYANRGIPLRRGYLFHGPPGTGKTSLSFALAGVFGLDIFVISLLEPSLTEDDLGSLFNSLPRRCVVLLEDIDTAGLSRSDEDEEFPADEKAANDWKVSDLARALKKQSKADEKNGISMSGLLNVIDGVASHEGRVLIMTTNHPESLDDALIRPGRVDLQVAFTNATKTQARELFECMYEADRARLFRRQEQASTSSPSSPTSATSATYPLSPAIGKFFSKFPVGEAQKQQQQGEPQPNGLASVPTPPMSPVSPVDGGGGGGGGGLDTVEEENAAVGVPRASSPEDERLEMSGDTLTDIAEEFAAQIPDGQFSPAEIQGFLLKRKKTPRRAVAEAGKWVEAMVQQKAKKTKVLQVQ